jgi:O-antigen biosynthesis protein WbqP
VIIIALKKFICLVGLVLISPLLLICCVLIALEDGLPFFFTQKRIGLNKVNFTIYKLRTLKYDAPQVGTHDLEDSIKLKTGSIIRGLKLDEFPQLLNVIKGELNLVGPRPCLESQEELKKVRELNGVFSVTPGITGLSQILGYDMSNPSQLAKVDQLYIQNQTLKLDLIILIGTFVKLPRNCLALKFNIPNLKK